jgi:hypothetical protein
MGRPATILTLSPEYFSCDRHWHAKLLCVEDALVFKYRDSDDAPCWLGKAREECPFRWRLIITKNIALLLAPLGY